MSENKDTLAAGVPTDFHSSPCPINGAHFYTCGHSFNSGKGREIFVQKPVDKFLSRSVSFDFS